MMFLAGTCALFAPYVGLQDTGVLAAAEYGPLGVWADSLRFSGPSAASTAAGRCTSAVHHLDR